MIKLRLHHVSNNKFHKVCESKLAPRNKYHMHCIAVGLCDMAEMNITHTTVFYFNAKPLHYFQTLTAHLVFN